MCDVDDAAQHPPVINTRNAVREWEMERQTGHLGLAREKQLAHHGLLFTGLESNPQLIRIEFKRA